MTTSRPLALAAATAALCAVVAGCSHNPPAPPPPPRPSLPAGPVYAPFTRFLAAHPQRHRPGMTYGILVRSSSHGYLCLSGDCHTWHGTVVVAGARVEQVSSNDGDDGMATVVSPGDLFWLPAGGPVEATSDDAGTLPVTVILAGAVKP